MSNLSQVTSFEMNLVNANIHVTPSGNLVLTTDVDEMHAATELDNGPIEIPPEPLINSNVISEMTSNVGVTQLETGYQLAEEPNDIESKVSLLFVNMP